MRRGAQASETSRQDPASNAYRQLWWGGRERRRDGASERRRAARPCGRSAGKEAEAAAEGGQEITGAVLEEEAEGSGAEGSGAPEAGPKAGRGSEGTETAGTKGGAEGRKEEAEVQAAAPDA